MPGSVGGKQIEAMLCDSGATICVIAEHLIPEGTELLDNVWVGTVDVEPRSYPTVIVPAVVQGKPMELYAAVMPAKRLPYPVILGRYIPGKTVVWSMKVTNEHGTILQLTQESGVSNKDIAEKEQQSNELEDSEGAQVVDGIERPTGDQKSSAELKQTQSKSKKFTRIEGVMVEQIEKERRAKRDEEATAASGVVLSHSSLS